MNLMDIVSVELTNYGKIILDNYRNNLEKQMNLKFEFTLSYDENGRYITEMWNLMSIFGKYITDKKDEIFKIGQIRIL